MITVPRAQIPPRARQTPNGVSRAGEVREDAMDREQQNDGRAPGTEPSPVYLAFICRPHTPLIHGPVSMSWRDLSRPADICAAGGVRSRGNAARSR